MEKKTMRLIQSGPGFFSHQSSVICHQPLIVLDLEIASPLSGPGRRARPLMIVPADSIPEGMIGGLPSDALATAVAQEADERRALVAVQAVNRVVQPALRLLVGVGRDRVVDPVGPALLLKRGQDSLLVGSRHLELLDDLSADPKFLAIAIPAGLETREDSGGHHHRCREVGP